MAEGYLVKRLRDIGAEDAIVISSGTGAIPGLRPTQETVEVMKENGVDVSGYVSSTLSKASIENADVVLTMEPRHTDRVLSMVPKAKNKRGGGTTKTKTPNFGATCPKNGNQKKKILGIF